MSSTPVQEYAVLNEVKLKLNISTSDTSQDVQITVATNDSNNYIAEQTAVHATVVVAGNDPSLSSMANNLAAAYFNFWISTDKDREEIERWQNRIQQYIMAKYGKKSANLLSGEDTFGVTSGFVSSSSGVSPDDCDCSPLTTKGDIWGYDLTDNRIPVGTDGLILTSDSSAGLGVSWQVAGGGLGDVIGPSGATDEAIARYDTITGKLIQNSGVLIDDSDNVTGVTSIAIGDGTWVISEDGSDQLLFTSPTGDGNQGIKVVSDTGEINLQNIVSNTSDDYTAVLSTNPNVSSDTTDIAFTIQNNITTASDSGTEPITQIQGIANEGTVSNRPIIGFYNFNTKLLQIDSDGTADFQGNTITNAVLQANLTDGSMYLGDENNALAEIPTGLETKEDCRVATTPGENIDLASATNPNPIDGVTLSTNERILLKNQTTPSENGIYDTGVSGTNPTNWARATDADTSVEVNNGMFTLITEGTDNANTAWVLSTSNPITLNTTELTFDEFSFTDIAHLNSAQTFTGVNTFGVSGDVGKLLIAGTTSGSTIINATPVASGTLTLPAATDVLIARDTVDTLTNKTIDANNNPLSNLVIGAEVTGASTALTDSASIARNTDTLDFFASTTSAQLASVISDETGTGLLVFGTSPTIVTPTIDSFTNATHDHEDAAGGAQLTASNALDATGTPDNTTFLRGDDTWVSPTDLSGITSINADTTAAQLLVQQANKILIASDLAGNHTFTIGTDIVTLTDTQELFNKTLNTPTIDSFTNATHDHVDAAGGGQLLSTTALSDTASIAYLNTANSYIAGNKQSFVADATTAGINLNAQLPSGLAAGDIYRTAEVMHFIGTTATDYTLVSDGQPTTYTAGAKQSFVADSTTAGININNQVPSTTTGGDIWRATDALTYRNEADDVDIVIATTSGTLAQFASTTSAQLASVISDETGTGLLVFGTSPTLVTPTIALFSNAQHDHEDADGGNQLTIPDASDASGTPGNTTFLRGDNTWAIPVGSGDMLLAATQTVTGAKTFLDTTLLLQNVGNTFNGSFVNTNTADRVYTLQDSTDVLVGRDTTDTLTNKTLTTPTIGSFSNATHDHTAGSGGGQLTNTALSSGVFSAITGVGTQSQDLDMNSNKVVTLGTPTAATDATTKAYVDAIAAGLEWKEAALAGTTVDITLANSQTIDGVAVVNPDRVLVKNQSTASENGIYEVVDAGSWTRTTDADTGLELEHATIFVQEGTVNAGTAFTCTSSNITIGVTDIDWVEIFNTILEAGDGLVVSGNVIDVGAGTGITVNTDDVALTIPVIVSSGGTGATSLTDGGILLGSGAGAITATAVLGDGEILIGDGTTDPVTLDVGSSTAITILGTISTGVWNGTDIAVSDGGTGVGTFTSGGILYGNAATDIQVTTAPTSGQIIVGNTTVPAFVTMSGDASIDNTGTVTVSIASTDLTDSANLARVTTANTFGAFLQSFATSSMRIPVSATPTMAEDGDFAIDTTVADFSHGIIKYFDGEEIGVVSMPIIQFTTPTGGDVVAYNATDDEFELVTPSGSGITSINGNTTPAQVISGTTNQITVGSAAGTTTIDVGSNVVLTSQSNTYTGGLKQQFLPDATNAGINVGTAAANPSSATNGDMYYNTASGEFRIVRTGTWDDVVTATGTQTLTNKTLTSPTINDFTNAAHDHSDAAGGAQLLSTSALSDTNTIAYLNTANTFGAFLQSFATSSMRIPVSATPTMAEDGDFAIDTTVADFSHGIIKYFDGEEIGVVSMPIIQFTTPTGGDVVAYNATDDEFELVTPVSGSVDAVSDGTTTVSNPATINFTDTAGGVNFAVADNLPTATVTATVDSGYTGGTSIVTLGTIATGVWNGTTIAVADGGTGVTTSTGTTSVVLSNSPTLVTPNIASFTNATHDHTAGSGGGQLTNTALTSGVFSAITGIGTQSQDLDMNNNAIVNSSNITIDNVSAVGTLNIGRSTPAVGVVSGEIIFLSDSDEYAKITVTPTNVTLFDETADMVFSILADNTSTNMISFVGDGTTPDNSIIDMHDRRVRAIQRIQDVNDNEQLIFESVASAENEFTLTNAITATNPILAATGDDTDIGMNITTKGVGDLNLQINNVNALIIDESATQIDAVDNFVFAEAGTPISPIGLQNEWIPGVNIFSQVTAGPSTATLQTPTNNVNFAVLEFNQNTEEFAQFTWTIPTTWNAGTITIEVFWTCNGGTAAETVDWLLTATGYADGDPLDVAFPTSVSITDTFIADLDLHITDKTGAITIGGAPVAGDMIQFRISRDVSNDDLGTDALLMGVRINYSTSFAVAQN